MSVRKRKWTNNKGKARTTWIVHLERTLKDGRTVVIKKTPEANTREAAEILEREILNQIAAGTWDIKAPSLETAITPTMEEFVERFLQYSENNNKFSTVETKRHILKAHLLPFFGTLRLDRIGMAHVEAFKAQMRKKPSMQRARKANPSKYAVKKRYGGPAKLITDKAINNCLAVLRRLLSLAQEQEVIAHVPRVKLFKVQKPAYDFLDFEEAERLLGAVEVEWKALLMTAIKTGLRQGELIGLQWADLDLVRGKLNVRRTIWKGVSGLPKGGRARTVDMPSSVVSALKAARHLKGPYVFCQPDGKPLTPGLMKAPLIRALKRAGISREEGLVGWHDLRHTYGSHLAMLGVPPAKIQHLMGHATLEMTMRYAHLSPETLQSAVQLLDGPAPTFIGPHSGNAMQQVQAPAHSGR